MTTNTRGTATAAAVDDDDDMNNAVAVAAAATSAEEGPAIRGRTVNGDRKSTGGTRDTVGRENWRLAHHGAGNFASDGCRVISAGG